MDVFRAVGNILGTFVDVDVFPFDQGKEGCSHFGEVGLEGGFGRYDVHTG